MLAVEADIEFSERGGSWIVRVGGILFIYLGLRRFQHCIGHSMMGSFTGRENQYIQFLKVIYCKLLTIS